MLLYDYWLNEVKEAYELYDTGCAHSGLVVQRLRALYYAHFISSVE